MKQVKKFYAAGVIVVILVSVLFSKTMLFNPDRYTTIFTQIQSLEVQDAKLDAALLKTLSGLSGNYDELVSAMNALNKTLDGLDLQNFEKTPEDMQIVEEMRQQFASKGSAIERYKSLHSVIKNSVNYLAAIPASSTKTSSLDAWPERERLFGRIQYYLHYPDMQSREPIELMVANLDKTMRHNSVQTDEFKNIETHTRFILDKAPLRRQMIADILGIPTHSQSQKLYMYCLSEYEQAMRRVSKSRTFLFLLGLVLILCILAILGLQERHISKQTKSLKEKNEKLNQSLSQLNETQSQLLQTSKLSALGEMAGGVAHEINNPIAVILLMAEEASELIQETNFDKEATTKALAKIGTTAKRIATIVTGLRTFSRDGTRDSVDTFKVSGLIDETLSFCAERFKNHGIKFEVAPFDPGIEIHGRRVQLSQVLLNLLNNSFDAVGKETNPWVRIEVQRTETTTSIVVTDSGSGLPPHIAQKVFQPFFTTKEVNKGTGLGLSISSGIVESHRGKLFVDGKSANTKFVIQLPNDPPLISAIKAA